MLYYRSAGYETSTRTLTVRYRSPSGGAWASYEYRDVPPAVYRRVIDAQPDAQRVIDKEVAPLYDVRRCGEQGWRKVHEDSDDLRTQQGTFA